MREFRKHLAVAICASAVFLTASQVAWGEAPSSSSPSSVVAPASERLVAEFKGNKLSLLKANPVGGIQLTMAVKALVLADPGLVQDLIALSKQGNNPQAASIGAGIGQAAKALFSTGNLEDKKLGEGIAAAVATGSAEMLAGYAVGSGETPTYQVASGGRASFGGGFSGTGGAVGTGPSSFVFGGSAMSSQTAGSSFTNSAPTFSFSYGGATASGATVSTPSYGGVTVIVNSNVSPSVTR
jgi:hypothetical protein